MEQARPTYSRVAIWFHWGIGLLIVANLVTGLFHDDLGFRVMPFHKASGITILVLSVARLLWRLTHRPPPLAPTVKWWERGLAHFTHWIFYVLMIIVPFSGWALVSFGARRFPLDWFGLFQIPFLPVEQNMSIADAMEDRHETLALLWLALLVLHVAGALKHHFIDRDNTLARMLPLVRPRS